MKKAEELRWSSLEAEDEIQPKPFTKNGKSNIGCHTMKKILLHSQCHCTSYLALVDYNNCYPPGLALCRG